MRYYLHIPYYITVCTLYVVWYIIQNTEYYTVYETVLYTFTEYTVIIYVQCSAV